MDPDLNRRQREGEKRRQAAQAEGNGNGQSELMEEVRPHDRGFAEDPVVDFDSGGAGIDGGSSGD